MSGGFFRRTFHYGSCKNWCSSFETVGFLSFFFFAALVVIKVTYYFDRKEEERKWEKTCGKGTKKRSRTQNS